MLVLDGVYAESEVALTAGAPSVRVNGTSRVGMAVVT
jgi:hypothetical protein